MFVFASVLAWLAYPVCGKHAHLIAKQHRDDPKNDGLGQEELAQFLLLLHPASNRQFRSPTVVTEQAGMSPAGRTRDLVLQANDRPEPQGGHKVPKTADVDPEEQALMERVREHQTSAARLEPAEDVRTLVQYNHGYAVISTNSKEMDGYPSGSVVGFAPDENGCPVFSFSKLSTHTQDLLKDPKCSVTIAAKEYKGAADGRVNLIGECKRITDEEEIEALKKVYAEKHPNAFWINFGDFLWFRQEVKHVRYVGGFARAGKLSSDEYMAAKPDPITAIQTRVATHMNDDHRDATVAMVRNYIGLDVEDASISSLDRLGMFVKVTRKPGDGDGPLQEFKLRLPWLRPTEDPKKIKSVIVEMTQASSEFMPAKETQEA